MQSSLRDAALWRKPLAEKAVSVVRYRLSILGPDDRSAPLLLLLLLVDLEYPPVVGIEDNLLTQFLNRFLFIVG
ncbi:hypothetical protein FD723_25090 [Nostoc sp. C052]|uniref:hypothetical protein n=1 Tax=Nostoc sp. C052 TaxID=2576902 RepID=UPI0015C40545|nr:hypothetical protein [Nostoc sp. C052]QLE43400.1 hypothetical protein FD723_25090 [Nostoc sp. C052]